jgi:hypothetical protein
MPLSVRRRSTLLLCAAVAAVIGTAPIARAQVLYGSIVGTVTDGTGATLPGATVVIEQSETKLTRELTSDPRVPITSPRCRPAPTRSR